VNPVDWLQIFALIGVGVTIIGGIVGFLRWITTRVRNFEEQVNIFMRDWQGEPAAPGRDAVPGVMARLNNIDGELKHNGGSTMKDAVKRIERTLENIEHRLIDGDEKFNKVESEIAEIKRNANEH